MADATVGVLHPGDMGAALGSVLRKTGTVVLWVSSGRSAATARRAETADLRDVGSVDELSRRSDMIVSVCPPHAAAEVARSVSGFKGTFVDVNAVSPATARAVAAEIETGGGRYVDGGIVGPPPRSRRTTRLYLSGPSAQDVAGLFASTVVDVRVVSDRLGAASALKMSYAAWTKGTAALLLAIRALARAEDVEAALRRLWDHPKLLIHAEAIPQLPSFHHLPGCKPGKTAMRHDDTTMVISGLSTTPASQSRKRGTMRRFVIWTTLVATLLAVAAPTYLVTAAPSSIEQENEPIVYRGSTGCGVERWSVKTGMDSDAGKVNAKSVTQTTIFNLRSLRPPGALPLKSRVRPVETTVFSVSAKLLRVKQEADSDFHLVLSDTGGRTMIAEIPSPSCVGSSPFLPSMRYVRSKFTTAYHPTDFWKRPNVAVQVTGVGFFDRIHGQSGVAPNGIELHPVLAIRIGGSSGPPPPTPTPGKPKPSGNLSVSAYVSPNPVSYGANPTLYAKSTPGASCSAQVVYSTGRPPRSFDGSAKTVGSSGVVSWSWHMESKRTGGTATVSCSLRGQTKTATASFRIS